MRAREKLKIFLIWSQLPVCLFISVCWRVKEGEREEWKQGRREGQRDRARSHTYTTENNVENSDTYMDAWIFCKNVILVYMVQRQEQVVERLLGHKGSFYITNYDMKIAKCVN